MLRALFSFPKRSLLGCSGVDTDVLSKCPQETTKFVAQGAAILIAAILAFVTSSYALFTVFHSRAVALLLGLLYAVIIFGLDYALVAAWRREGKWWRDGAKALPRLTIAVVMGITVANPLELAILAPRIEQEITLTHQEQYTARRRELDKDPAFQKKVVEAQKNAADAKKNYDQIKVERDRAYRARQDEADGSGGSRKIGKGDLFAEKDAEFKRVDGELEKANNALKEAEAASKAVYGKNEAEKQRLFDEFDRKQRASDDLLTRNEGLHRLTKKSEAANSVCVLLSLLFICIDTAPVITKTLSVLGKASDYDLALEEMGFAKRETQKNENLHEANLQKDRQLTHRQAEAEANNEGKKAFVEIAKETIEAWKVQEIDAIQEKLRSFRQKAGAVHPASPAPPVSNTYPIPPTAANGHSANHSTNHSTNGVGNSNGKGGS